MSEQIVKIKKLGFVDQPINPNSDFGSKCEYHYGYFKSNPKIGERFELYPISFDTCKQGIITTKVIEIKENNIFHTGNSIYQYEFIDKL